MAEVEAVVVQSEGVPLPVVRLWIADVGDQYVRRLSVEINAEGLYCRTAIVDSADDALPEFFESLESDWRGWVGVREWEALEHALRIEASHHGAKVQLLFIVRRDFKADAWEARVSVHLAAGEPLRRLAKDVRRLLALG